MSPLAPVLALAIAAAPTPSPTLRAELPELAYALGEAHALRQACRGRGDGYWRTRMSAVLDRERPPREQRLQLIARFNGGFEAARAAHPACDEAALREALDRAAPLARRLGRPE